MLAVVAVLLAAVAGLVVLVGDELLAMATDAGVLGRQDPAAPAADPVPIGPNEPDLVGVAALHGPCEDAAPFDDGAHAVLPDLSPADPSPADQVADEPPPVEDRPASVPGDPDELFAELAVVQQRLVELGYLVAEADGRGGAQTRAAVMAFQSVQGLAVDGVVGPVTRAALADPVAPSLLDGPADRIEVDLDRQVLHLVADGERVVTLKVSSGNGRTYRGSRGGLARARTPVGWFEVERIIRGVRNAPLGRLDNPLYFYRGFAIHGSGSVPAGPASHGCVRITRADSRWLVDRVEVGVPVHLHGGEHVFRPG